MSRRTEFRSTRNSWLSRWCGFLRIRESLRCNSSGGFLIRKGVVFRSDEGASLIEMALATAILSALLFGVFEFSLASYTYHYISDAAREGARWAIVRGDQCSSDMPWALSSFDCNATTDEIASYVEDLGYPGINSTYMTVSTTWLAATQSAVGSSTSTTTWSACGTADSCKVPGNEVQVTVSYNFPLSIPFWTSKTIPISSTSTMVISQ